MSEVSATIDFHQNLHLNKSASVILLNQLFLCDFSDSRLKRAILQMKKEISLNVSDEVSVNWMIWILSSETSVSSKIYRFFEEKFQDLD